MRGRILVPILMLLAAFCVVLAYAVYSNVSNATSELINKQLDGTLELVEKNLVEQGGASANLNNSEYQELVEGLGVSDGGVLIINESGVVVADSLHVMTNKRVSDQEWYQEALRALNGEFNAIFGQTEVYARSVQISGTVIVSYLSNDSVSGLFVTPLYVIGVVGLVSVVIVGILIYFLITRLVINPLESLDEQVHELDSVREIDLEPLKLCPEIAAPAEQFNRLLSERQRGGPADSLSSKDKEEESLEDTGGATNFELVALLREVFEEHRQAIASKDIKFSMLVENGTPEVVFANKDFVFSGINKELAAAITAAHEGSKVEAKIAFTAPKPEFGRDEPALLFEVYYNDLGSNVLLAAKKEQ